MADVIGEELPLVAVHELQAGQRHDACVGDDAVELRALRLDRGHAGPHRFRVGQLTLERQEHARHAPERIDHLLLAAPGRENAGAALSQHAHGLEPNARRAARDQEILALERNALGHDLSCRAVAITAGTLAFEQGNEAHGALSRASA